MNATQRTPPEVAFALAGAVMMIAGHVAGKASRDALFLLHFDATDLPKVMIGSAAVSIVSAFAVSRWLTLISPARLVPLTFVASALALVGEWFLVTAAPRIGAVALYLHMGAFGAILISSFWSVINERFDPHTARRTISRIAAAATGGGILGGLSAERLSALFGLPAMLLAMGAMHAVCAFCVRGIGAPRAAQPAAETPGGLAAGLNILRQTPYLQQMAGLVALCAVVDALLDYALKFEAAAAFESEKSLIQFFAIFYTLTGILAFAAQAGAGSRVLKRYGLGGAMLALPATILVMGALATAVTRLWSVAVLRATESMASNSLFRAGFELLYNPMSRETKRPTKIFVDVGAQRLGDLAGSGLILGLLALLPAAPTQLVIGLTLAVGAGVWFSVRAVQGGYVKQLAGSLRSGLLALDDVEVVDATTERTIAATQMALDRESLLAMIRERHPERALAEGAPADENAAPAVPPEELLADPTLRRIAELYSGDPERIRRVLSQDPEDPILVGHAIGLLERSAVADDAIAFLRRVAPRASGQLVDAILDASRPLAVRRRLARILEVCNDARTVEGLFHVLSEDPPRLPPSRAIDQFEVRYHAAQAAARIVSRNPELSLSAETLHRVVLRELGVDDRVWERQGHRPAALSHGSVLLDRASIRRMSRSLEHVFTILSLALEREVMASTLAGLYSEDENLRGTALEYLEVTLPPALVKALTPRLARARAAPRSERPPSEIADELLRSSSAIVVGREQLQKD